MNLLNRIRSAYGLLVNGASYLQSPLLLAIRLYWGWQFCQTGWGKLMNLERTTSFFAELGIPMPQVNAALAGGTECFGGLLLLVGLASRLTALPLIATMVVAYITADNEALKAIFSDSDKFVTAAPFLFLFASVIVLVFGPGAFSLDRLIAWKLGDGTEPGARSAKTSPEPIRGAAPIPS